MIQQGAEENFQGFWFESCETNIWNTLPRFPTEAWSSLYSHISYTWVPQQQECVDPQMSCGKEDYCCPILQMGWWGRVGQWFLVHKHCHWWKSISPSLLSSNPSIALLYLPAEAFVPSHLPVLKIKYFLLLWMGRLPGQFQYVCSALSPCVAPLLIALLLLVAALDLLSTDKPVLKPLWDSSPCALCKDVW